MMESKKWFSVLHQSKVYFQGHSPETIKALLEQCGFQHIDARIKRPGEKDRASQRCFSSQIPHAFRRQYQFRSPEREALRG